MAETVNNQSINAEAIEMNSICLLGENSAVPVCEATDNIMNALRRIAETGKTHLIQDPAQRALAENFANASQPDKTPINSPTETSQPFNEAAVVEQKPQPQPKTEAKQPTPSEPAPEPNQGFPPNESQACIVIDGEEECGPMDVILEKLKAEEAKPQKKNDLDSNFTPAAQGETEAQKETVIHAGRGYYVPENYESVLKQVTEGDPVSYELMVKILGSESNFDNEAVSTSGAFSAGQFVSTTFYQRAWENRGKLKAENRAIIEANLEEYDKAAEDETALAKEEKREPRYVAPDPKWRIREGGDKDAIMALAKNEYVVSVLAREHIRQSLISGKTRFRSLVEERLNWLTKPTNPDRLSDDHPRVVRLREHLERPLTFTDAKTFYLCGARGGAELLLAYADLETQDHRAKDYTTETVAKNNKLVFEHSNGSDRSVPAYMDYMHERVGNQPLPENLTRPPGLPQYAIADNKLFNPGP